MEGRRSIRSARRGISVRSDCWIIMSGICQFYPFVFFLDGVVWWLMRDRVFKSNAAVEDEGDAIEEEQ